MLRKIVLHYYIQPSCYEHVPLSVTSYITFSTTINSLWNITDSDVIISSSMTFNGRLIKTIISRSPPYVSAPTLCKKQGLWLETTYVWPSMLHRGNCKFDIPGMCPIKPSKCSCQNKCITLQHLIKTKQNLFPFLFSFSHF